MDTGRKSNAQNSLWHAGDVTNWRDTASQQVQDDLDRLFSLTLDHASPLLKDRNRLVPFAAAITDDGDADVLSGLVDERGPARAVLDRLYAAARGQAERYRAVAFAAVITLDDARAVRIEAEHREGIALALRVPYRIGFLGNVRLGTMQLSDGPVRLWR